MASNIKIVTSLRNAMNDAITAAISTSGLLKIYDGTQPATPATAITTQVLLVTLPLSSAFAPASSSGVLTANAITTTNAVATSTATWFTLETSAAARIIDGSVGTSGADINFNTVSFVNGGPVAVSSLTFTAPGG